MCVCVLNLAMNILQLQWWIFLGPSSLAWAHSQGHGMPTCTLPRLWQPSASMQPKPWHTHCLGLGSLSWAHNQVYVMQVEK